MTVLQTTVAATSANGSLSLLDLLRRLHQRGRLQPLLREVALEQSLLSHATQVGLTITNDELQQAANRFRQRNGLASAELTKQWLAGQGLSEPDFEAVLERDLLTDKFKDHLAATQTEATFTAQASAYDRVRLRLLVVPREDLANELLNQLHEDSADFAQLARTHSIHPSCTHGGLLGLIWHKHLRPEVGERVGGADVGDVVGPVATPEGFCLFLVEDKQPAELDEPTRALIRQEVYNAWVHEQLPLIRVDLSWLHGS